VAVTPVVVTPLRAAASPTQATAMAAYSAKRWDSCAEQFTAIANASTKLERFNGFYSAACCYAHGGKPDLAFARMDAAIAAGLQDVSHVAVDPDLVDLHGDPRWPRMLAATKEAAAAWERSLKDPELRRELLALVAEDQAARMAWIEKDKRGEKADWAPVAAIDRKTTKAVRVAIAKYGWPGKSTVGEDGAHAAWLLVQHAAKDPALQKDALARMKPMVETGEVTNADYAYLEDRVAVAEHRKQRYGTQFNGRDPEPIEDEANVDARRKEIGLGTMAEYRQDILKMYGPAKPVTAPKN
jgi:Family of unknown function (DUF6624)